MPDRTADTRHPILDVLTKRYSPYVYESRPVENSDLLSCFEAAAWAASSYNEQPWRFIVAKRENTKEFDRVLECLLEANQVWAKNAGVLILAAVSTQFQKNQKPNRVAIHDLGLAMGNFSIQATSLGLAVHQMAGVNLSKVRSEFKLPDDIEPVTAIAVGYAGDPGQADNQDLADRDRGSRSRKPLSEFVFETTFGQAADWTA